MQQPGTRWKRLPGSFGQDAIQMKRGVAFSIIGAISVALIGCRGNSQIPPLPPGTVCTITTGQASISGNCTLPPCPNGVNAFGKRMGFPGMFPNGTPPSPSAGTNDTPSVQPSPVCVPPPVTSPVPLASSTPAPITTPTPLPSATSVPTAAPSPSQAPSLSGIWIWKGFATGQGSAQIQGNIPNVALLNALSGSVQITTNSFASMVQISNNTCPPSFNVQAGNGGLVSLSVNNSVMNCQFTVTDPTTGSTNTVLYSNTST